MKKFRNLLLVVFVALLTVTAFTFTACKARGDDSKHTHTYSSQWTYDESYHWHKATCEHTAEINGRAAHSFEGIECSVCHYVKGETVDPNPTQITVTFSANGGKFENGKTSYTKSFNSGDLLSSIDEPKRDGYRFNGWYSNNLLTDLWNFEKDIITESITLYAGWTEVLEDFDVTFNLNYSGASEVVRSTENGFVTYIPIRTGYEFNGWYIDSELLHLFDMSQPVTNTGLELYASWVEEATEIGQLSAPIIGVDENVFSWEEVSGATGYRIIVQNTNTTENIIDESIHETNWTFPERLDAGIYTVKIRAVGNGVTTVNSVYASRKFALRVLGSVSGFTFDKATSILSWKEVSNAANYQVYIGDNLVSTQEEVTIDLSNYNAGSLNIKVMAIRENWLSSSGSTTIAKMRLKTPEVQITIDPNNNSYELSWNAVLYADTYIIQSGEKEIKVETTNYTIANDSELWINNTIRFAVNAFDSKADYLISSGAKEHTINKIFNLQIDKSLAEAGTVEVEGSIWTPVVVTFDLNGASGNITSQTITTNQGLVYPAIPVRDGYIFRGWFTEKSCENLFDFSATVERSVTLYAGWQSYTGTFIELNSGRQSLSSGSTYKYYYFRALSNAQIRISYNQTSSSPTSYMMLYDVTKGEVWTDEQSFNNTSSSTSNFYPIAGHVYYIRLRSTSTATINLALTTYPSDTYLPNDGGCAKSDYVLGSSSNATTNFVTYSKEYTLTATTRSGYAWLGWYDGDTLLTREEFYTFVMSAENVVYTAKWIECPITLEKNLAEAGSVSGIDGAISVGEEITITATTNAGYTWLGWYNGDTEITKELSYTFTVPAENVVYTAKWAYYTVTTEKNYNEAGMITDYADKKITVGNEVTVTATTNAGYTWLGWYNGNIELTKDLRYTFTMTAENVVYTAKWTYYTVTTEKNYNEAGTITDYADKKVTVGELVTLTATTNDGYNWLGWFNGDIELTKELSYTFTMLDNNVVYTAKWSYYTVSIEESVGGRVEYKGSAVVKFDLNGGMGEIADQIVSNTVGVKFPNPIPKKDGYVFRGWFIDSACTKYFDFTSAIDKDITLYAGWWNIYTGVSSSVSKSSMDIIDLTGGKQHSFSTATSGGRMVFFPIYKTGSYTFYYKNSSSNSAYKAAITLYNQTQNSNSYLPSSYCTSTTYKSVTISANAGDVFMVWGWKGSTSASTISFYIVGNEYPEDGGVYNKDLPAKVSIGETVSLQANTNAGYTWLGWYNGNVELTKELSYTFTMPSENVALMAKWVKTTIECSSADAGSVTSLDGTYNIGDQVTVIAATNEGYTWLGWYNGDIELTKELNYTFTMSSENVTYTAKWVKATIESNLADAGSVTELTGTYTVGDEVTVTATTNAGYTWLGWYNGNVELTKELSYTFTMPSENVVYTAKWIECPVTINKNMADAGTVSDLPSKTSVGDEVTVTATTNAGYTWLGWYNGDIELTKELIYTFTMSSESVVYTAKWACYTVTTKTDNTNAGSYTVKNSEKITVGQLVSISATTNIGYTWLGWYNGDSELTKDLNYTFNMPAKNVILTAKWINCPVELNKNIIDAGTVSGLENPTSIGDEITVIASTNKGYTWLGWYNGDIELTKELSYTFTMSSENVTYTAKWACYTLTTASDDSDAGSVTVKNNEKVSAGEAVNIQASAKNGYSFDGWYKGDIKVSDEDNYTFIMPTETIIYVAKWTYYTLTVNNTEGGVVKGVLNSRQVTVSFNLKGGTGNIPQQVVTDKKGLIYPSTIPTKSGYVFTGWYKDANCKEIFDFSEDVFEDITLYAGWQYHDFVSNDISIYYLHMIDAMRHNSSSSAYTISNQSFNTNNQWAGIYFSALTSGEIKIYYRVNSSADANRMRVRINNLTQGSSEILSTDCKSTTYLSVTTNVNAGDILRISVSSYSIMNTVSFYTYITGLKTPNDGGIVSENAFINGNKFTAGQEKTLTAVTDNGYTWVGWYCGDNLISTNKEYTLVMPKENVVYTAKWAKTIISADEGGEVTQLNGQYNVGDEVTISATNYKGYRWRGWFKDDEFITNDQSFTFTLTSDSIVYTAKWYVNEDLNNFVIESDVDKLIIKGVKDNSVQRIDVPDYVDEIAFGAFSDCTSLVWISIPFVGGSANESKPLFGYIFGVTDNKNIPTSIRQVTITNGTTVYGFGYCAYLTEVILGNSITSIDSFAFSCCSSLVKITLGTGMVSIDSNAFSCEKLVEIVNLSGLQLECGSSANGNIAMNALHISDNSQNSRIVDYEGYLFYYDGNDCFMIGVMNNLDYMSTPEFVKFDDEKITSYSIYKYAFYNNHFTSVRLSDAVTSVGEYAFFNSPRSSGTFVLDSRLSKFTIGRNVQSIGDYAFMWCRCLVEITNLSNLNIQVGAMTNGYVAYYASYVYNQNNQGGTTLIQDDFILYENGDKVFVLGYIGENVNIVLPDIQNKTDYIIHKEAFEGKQIMSVVIPSCVTIIESMAFYDCYMLDAIYYLGTESEWNNIVIQSNNEELTSLNRYYYSESEPEELDVYWHFDENGSAIVWTVFDGSSFEHAIVAEVGQSYTINISKSQIVYFVFTSFDRYKEYTIKATGSYSTVVKLYSSSQSLIQQKQDTLTDDWLVGKYYVAVSLVNTSRTGNITFSIN